MDTVFPFGLPPASMLYATLLTVTFALHLFAAQFLLAGTGAVALLAARSPARPSPLRSVLVDWLPFAMGITITLGVAPLLFVQLVDQEGYYTANLLLVDRWIAILPVLVSVFYLLYLQKIAPREAKRPLIGRLVPTIAFLGVAFVALAFGENHLLSRDRSTWVETWSTGSTIFGTPTLLIRFGMVLAASVPALAVFCSVMDRSTKVVRHVALASIVIATLLAAVMPGSHDELARAFGLPWLVLAGVGALATSAALLVNARPAILVGAWSLAVLGLAGTREAGRWARLDLDRVGQHHTKVAESGGLVAFVAIAALVLAGLVYCLQRVSRELRAGR